MTTLRFAIRIVGIVWLFALAATVAVGMLRGTINTKGLLSEKRGSARGRTSPERVQLLLATLAAASTYVSQAAAGAASGHLPEVPGEWLALMGGSYGIYLAGKAVRAIRDRVTSIRP